MSYPYEQLSLHVHFSPRVTSKQVKEVIAVRDDEVCGYL